ncbi:MAG: hypothetical protein ABF293_12470 [Flavobacteriaceae bacterium]
MKPQYLQLLIYFVLVPISILAQEGNYRYESYGNQSVLLNGNVTGSAEDLGLTFYNPARLAFIEEPSIVIAGKAFQLINYNLQDVFESDVDLNESNFNGIPSIISGTFNVKFLPNHSFAYSFISRYRSDINLDYNSGVRTGLPIGDLPDVTQSFMEIFFRNRLRDEWYGISWAHKLNNNFSIGASLFGSIYELNGLGTIVISAEQEQGNVVSYLSRTDFTQKTYGLFLRIGAAWQVDKVSMGLNVALPFLAFKKRANLNSEEFLSGIGLSEDFFRVVDLDDLESERKTATSISYGLGFPIGKSKLHFSADYALDVPEYQRITLPGIPDEFGLQQFSFNEEFKAVFNFGAGADIYVSPSLRVLVSFSSDFSAALDNPNLFDVVNQSQSNINLFGDFWHFGLGPDLSFKWGKITLGTTYSRSSNQISEAPDIPDGEDDAPLSLTTAIGFERWRFIIGLEIPLISKKIKGLPIK